MNIYCIIISQPLAIIFHLPRKLIKCALDKIFISTSADLNTNAITINRHSMHHANINTPRDCVISDHPAGGQSPSIERSPVQSIQTWVGQTVELSCVAEGWPLPTYRWYKDDTSLNISRPRFSQNGGHLVISMVTVKDSGEYRCNASNSRGAATATRQLTVKGTGWGIWAHFDNGGPSDFALLVKGQTSSANILGSSHGPPLAFLMIALLTSNPSLIPKFTLFAKNGKSL